MSAGGEAGGQAGGQAGVAGPGPVVLDGRPRWALEEEREFLLESLRDLDAELDAGDIDRADYETLRDDYTARTASVLRQLQLIDNPPAAAEAAAEPVASLVLRGRSPRSRTRTGAAGKFLPGKPVLIALVGAAVASLAGWAVVASSGTRVPGETITGQPVGQEAVAQLLLQAQTSIDRGDPVAAVQDYQKILSQQPRQPQALTEEGWLLAQTQQPALLSKGLKMLGEAEAVDPTYALAHVYRGIAFLSEGNRAAAIPELQYYLAHHPDPKLAPKVRAALAQAQAAPPAGP